MNDEKTNYVDFIEGGREIDFQRPLFQLRFIKGRPEPLKHQLKGYWSRRITDEHRLVYKIAEDQNVVTISCKCHDN